MRLAELLGGLALASDVANGFPPGKVLRTAVLAVEIGRHAGIDEASLRDAYYVAVLRFLGCTAFAHEEAHAYGAGNDLVTRNVMALADVAEPAETLSAIVRRLGEGSRTRDRIKAIASLVLDREAVAKHARAQCDTSVRLGQIVGMNPEVLASLAQVCERWDGKGEPARISGEGLAIATRLLHVADTAEIAHHRGGEELARAVVQRRVGKLVDPAFAGVFLQAAGTLLASLDDSNLWERYLDAEPAPRVTAEDARYTDVAVAFAHFVDLKSVFTLGHSTGVAEWCARAGEAMGLSESAVRDLRHAALLHDLGRAAVPNRVWDRPGPLGALDWEQVRFHAYETDRILNRAPAWRRVATIAAAAHERLDGNGYHRALLGAAISSSARILAAADVLHALREPRPHRSALSLDTAKDVLAEESRKGKLCPLAVDAVLAAAGAKSAMKQGAWPSALTDREVQVLRLVARGKTNKEIGVLLGISAKTVQHHVAHAYEKTGVYSRAGAALFITERGLLDGADER